MRGRTKLLIACLIIGCAAGAGYAAASNYLSELRDAKAYLGETTINGIPVQGKTPSQVAEILLAKPEDVSVSLIEKGETVLSGTLPEYGIQIDTESCGVSGVFCL